MPGRDIPKFHWADYLVFALNLLVSAAIGFYHGFGGNKQKTTKEFLVGGRNMKPFPVALSLLASFLSAPFLMGGPAEIYCFGTMYGVITLGFIICSILTAELFVPLFHKLELTSAYEYLEKRFSPTVRALGSFVFTVKMLLYMAVVIYAPAVAFTKVTGMPMWMTILGTGLVCTFYTTVGGMKAVIWADVVQMIIILVCCVILVVLGSIKAGGITNVISIANDGGRIIFNEFTPDPTVRHTFWTQTIGCVFTTSSILASNQVTIQRYLSIRKLSDAKKSLFYALGTMEICLILIVLLGLVLYALYYNCDPLTSGVVNSRDQLVPLFVMEVIGNLHGMPGLFSAAVFSATLSTVSSGLNALAAVVLIDMIKPAYLKMKGHPISEDASVKISKGLAGGMGITTICLAYLAPYMGPTLLVIALSIFGMIGGPLLGLFTQAIFLPMVNEWGALAGLLGSIIFTFWIAVGAIIYPNLPKMLPLRQDGCTQDTASNISSWSNVTAAIYTSTPSTMSSWILTENTMIDSTYKGIWPYKISYMWLALISVIVTILIGIPVSHFTGGMKGRQLDPLLTFPYGKKIRRGKRLCRRIKARVFCEKPDLDDLYDTESEDEVEYKNIPEKETFANDEFYKQNGDTFNNKITRDATNFRQNFNPKSNSNIKPFKRRWEKNEERRSIVWTGPEILWAETKVTTL